MNILLNPKPVQELYDTDIVYQTTFWGQVKQRLGWNVMAFDVPFPRADADVLVLERSLVADSAIAHVPQGPEYGPAPEAYGRFLERLSASMAEHLHPDTVCIRYDLPWPDPSLVADADPSSDSRTGLRRPPDRLRELRMNIGTEGWNLRKAPMDSIVADSLVVDLTGTPEEILTRMKPKTRYNIALAARRGVEVHTASAAALPDFYDLYLQTARRNGFAPCGDRHFSSLFQVPGGGRSPAELSFHLAVAEGEIIAGTIVAGAGRTATFLFGASGNRFRNRMGSCAVHWHAMLAARAAGYENYDMGAIAPYPDEGHPFFGMYRFKTGFGGRMVHRVGTWDYVLRPDAYAHLRNMEMMNRALRPD